MRFFTFFCNFFCLYLRSLFFSSSPLSVHRIRASDRHSRSYLILLLFSTQSEDSSSSLMLRCLFFVAEPRSVTVVPTSFFSVSQISRSFRVLFAVCCSERASERRSRSYFVLLRCQLLGRLSFPLLAAPRCLLIGVFRLLSVLFS